MNRFRVQRHLMLAGKIILAACLLVWLAKSGRIQLDRLTSVPLNGQFFALVVLVAGSLLIPALRWWWLLRIQGLQEPLGKIIKLTWSGYLAALILPGAASGDLAKTWLILRRREQARARAFSTVLADRFLGLYSLLCLGAISVLWMACGQRALGPAVQMMVVATLFLIVSMTVALAALFWRSTRTICFGILPIAWRLAWDESFGLYCEKLLQLLGCFGLSLISSTMAVASFSVAGGLLGLAITWDTAFLAGPLIVIANCLPFTPGGIGLAEAVSSELFSHLGSSGGAEIMVLTRICGILLCLPGILFVLKSNSSPSSELPQCGTVSQMNNEGAETEPAMGNTAVSRSCR